MPSTRKQTSRTGGSRITPKAVEAFKAGDEAELNRLLGIKPWQPSPLETDGPEPPEGDGTAWTAAWPEIYQLRQALEAADAN